MAELTPFVRVSVPKCLLEIHRTCSTSPIASLAAEALASLAEDRRATGGPALEPGPIVWSETRAAPMDPPPQMNLSARVEELEAELQEAQQGNVAWSDAATHLCISLGRLSPDYASGMPERLWQSSCLDSVRDFVERLIEDNQRLKARIDELSAERGERRRPGPRAAVAKPVKKEAAPTPKAPRQLAAKTEAKVTPKAKSKHAPKVMAAQAAASKPPAEPTITDQIVELLQRESGRSFTAKEIAREIDHPNADSIRATLGKLVGCTLVERVGVGHYRSAR